MRTARKRCENINVISFRIKPAEKIKKASILKRNDSKWDFKKLRNFILIC